MIQIIYIIANKETGMPMGIWETENEVNCPIEMADLDPMFNTYKIVALPTNINAGLDPKNKKDSMYLMEHYIVDISVDSLVKAKDIADQYKFFLPTNVIPAFLIEKPKGN